MTRVRNDWYRVGYIHVLYFMMGDVKRRAVIVKAHGSAMTGVCSEKEYTVSMGMKKKIHHGLIAHPCKIQV